ncbi:hypothetical protein [Hymenobacter sp. B81]|uniref:hypothetical protein n=1 Tax=Hymenobacter sp. B81 TaxID=3344878 RepID=UPI0037DCCDDF
MRTLRLKYLGDIPVDENNFKADFNVLEKYQAFSSEILRLSLLGLAVYGFLLTNIVFKVTQGTTFVFLKSFLDSKLVFIIGAIALIAAAFCALGHRYYSTDCMTHFIRRLRLMKKLAELQGLTNSENGARAVIEDLEEKVDCEDQSFERDLRKCKWLLIFSGLSFIMGVFFVMLGFGITLHNAATLIR